jgi:hypothetical protein
MFGKTGIRRVILGIAAMGVVVAMALLLLESPGSERDASADRELLEQAREIYRSRQEAARAAEEEARRLAEEEALRAAARARAARDVGHAADVDDPRDTEPVLGPDGLPDRGPPFDPYHLVMTGDRAYDLSTKRSAADRLYNQLDYDGALRLAREVLAESPDDVRTHLLMVLTACAMGDDALAREHRDRLPAADRTRGDAPCARAGIVFAGDAH